MHKNSTPRVLFLCLFNKKYKHLSYFLKNCIIFAWIYIKFNYKFLLYRNLVILAKREEIRLRRKQVAELYLKGYSQIQLAEKFGVFQQTISQDLKVIYKLWQQSAIRDFDTLKEKELIKLDNLEMEYWKAYQKSDNDPRYLSGVLAVIAKRCDVLGVNAPTKNDITVIDEQEARSRLLEKLVSKSQ